MTSNYQALTGLSDLTTDDLTINGTVTTDKLTFPTGAHQGWVLTSDDIGSASWQELVQTLLGDVTGPFQTNVVTKVGGSTAANIHQAELLANAATDLNSANAIVKRNGGNFSAGTITANLVGNVTGSSASFTSALAGDVTGTQGATVVAKVNGKAANQTVTLTDIQTLTNKTISGTFTGGLTGNASTVTTNANLTGDITSVGNATTASAAIAKLTTTQTLTNKTITGTTNNVDANTIRNGSTWAVPFSGATPATNNVLTYNGTNAVWQAPAAVSGVSTATASTLAQRDASAGCAFGPLTSTTLTASGLVTANNGISVSSLTKLGLYSTLGSTSIIVPVSATSGNCVQFLQLTATNGGYTVELSVAVSSASFSESAIYRVPVQFARQVIRGKV